MNAKIEEGSKVLVVGLGLVEVLAADDEGEMILVETARGPRHVSRKLVRQ